jgi:hypothetical protein
LILSTQFQKALNEVSLISKNLKELTESKHHKPIFIAYKADIYRMIGKNGAAEKLLRPIIVRLEKKSNFNHISFEQLIADLICMKV